MSKKLFLIPVIISAVFILTVSQNLQAQVVPEQPGTPVLRYEAGDKGCAGIEDEKTCLSAVYYAEIEDKVTNKITPLTKCNGVAVCESYETTYAYVKEHIKAVLASQGLKVEDYLPLFDFTTKACKWNNKCESRVAGVLGLSGDKGKENISEFIWSLEKNDNALVPLLKSTPLKDYGSSPLWLREAAKVKDATIVASDTTWPALEFAGITKSAPTSVASSFPVKDFNYKEASDQYKALIKSGPDDATAKFVFSKMYTQLPAWNYTVNQNGNITFNEASINKDCFIPKWAVEVAALDCKDFLPTNSIKYYADDNAPSINQYQDVINQWAATGFNGECKLNTIVIWPVNIGEDNVAVVRSKEPVARFIYHHGYLAFLPIESEQYNGGVKYKIKDDKISGVDSRYDEFCTAAVAKFGSSTGPNAAAFTKSVIAQAMLGAQPIAVSDLYPSAMQMRSLKRWCSSNFNVSVTDDNFGKFLSKLKTSWDQYSEGTDAGIKTAALDGFVKSNAFADLGGSKFKELAEASIGGNNNIDPSYQKELAYIYRDQRGCSSLADQKDKAACYLMQLTTTYTGNLNFPLTNKELWNKWTFADTQTKSVLLGGAFYLGSLDKYNNFINDKTFSQYNIDFPNTTKANLDDKGGKGGKKKCGEAGIGFWKKLGCTIATPEVIAGTLAAGVGIWALVEKLKEAKLNREAAKDQLEWTKELASRGPCYESRYETSKDFKVKIMGKMTDMSMNDLCKLGVASGDGLAALLRDPNPCSALNAPGVPIAAVYKCYQIDTQRGQLGATVVPAAVAATEKEKEEEDNNNNTPAAAAAAAATPAATTAGAGAGMAPRNLGETKQGKGYETSAYSPGYSSYSSGKQGMQPDRPYYYGDRSADKAADGTSAAAPAATAGTNINVPESGFPGQIRQHGDIARSRILTGG